MDAIKAIFSRSSTKSFGTERVSKEHLNTILAAGMSAPVGMRRYDTLRLTVIENEELLKAISENADMATAERPTAPLYGTKTLIIVSSRFEREDNIEYANVGCVMENMCIAATALGIGNVYLWGFLRSLKANANLLARLGLPEGFVPVSALALGYPTATRETDEPRHAIAVDYVE